MTTPQSSAISVNALMYCFGRDTVLDAVTFDVPQGAVYALLGANGAGKTTLLQLLAGTRRLQNGHAQLFGRDVTTLPMSQRQRISYVAEGQELPDWMVLGQLEAFCAPLYPSWDFAFASKLRAQFLLNPHQRIGAMSRGQRMKAALLCALAPKPKLIIMDEPFTGMDVVVKDEMVRGLLDAAGLDGTTVLICSHDIAELEPLADWVGFLDRGRMRLSAPIDELRARYKRVELLTEAPVPMPNELPRNWLSMERAGLRVSVLMEQSGDVPELPPSFRSATRVDVRDASLRELYIALASGKGMKHGVAS